MLPALAIEYLELINASVNNEASVMTAQGVAMLH